ncbi:PqqD family peptide modification chaperone [Sphingomonas baiyangensis]|uniref:PqqD family peptide modification chaperone n=1 Tax=Sphingomonas baiyangensis TaxID=2572576 RepID=UPI00146E55F7|nr:PqqD family peptide modification chaperone [Sphingomonas baiyangensis]
MIGADTILRRKADLVASDMDGETVMLDIESGHYFGLSGVGPHVWAQLGHDQRVGALIDGVHAAFAVSETDDVERDVLAFVQALHDKGLVQVVG